MTSLPRQALERAKELLANPVEFNLRYAALELRVVMEMVTYEKLVAAQDVIPPEVLKTWQPPQAVKSLLEFQEHADQTFTIEVAAPGQEPEDFDQLDDAEKLEHFQKLDFKKLGEHHALSLKWLKKNYNKIGNLLHAPSPGSSAQEPARTAKYLAEVVSELDLVLSSTISTFVERGGCVFSCQSCGKPVIRNAEAMKAGALAVCSTPDCDGAYRLVNPGDDEWTVEPVQAKFKCPACSHESIYWPRKVKVGSALKCPGCARRFGVFGYQWQLKELGPDEVMK
ncbi:hypothetical protein [Roseateles sp. BYS96W]|uniref:Uncharacterized protein n=1 Tax=Pelomonas nitida TaxID=3299027 RepID=A0ABW7GDA2_9BURK